MTFGLGLHSYILYAPLCICSFFQIAVIYSWDQTYFLQLGDPSKQEEIKHKSAAVKRELDRLNAERERLEALNEEREIRFSKMYDKVNKMNFFCQIIDKW